MYRILSEDLLSCNVIRGYPQFIQENSGVLH
jgi:hypothetical protein